MPQCHPIPSLLGLQLKAPRGIGNPNESGVQLALSWGSAPMYAFPGASVGGTGRPRDLLMTPVSPPRPDHRALGRRKLKEQLQHLRWRGARCPDAERREQVCARCQRALGRLLNRGAPCQGCSHRVCRDCRVFLGCSQAWKCTVCFEDR